MNAQSAPVPAPAPRRRRIWPWVVGVLVAPWLFIAIAVASYITLDRDAAALRRHVMAATHADWNTKIQVSVGSLTLGAIRSGMWFARGEDIEAARLALRSVNHASVGVYELASKEIKVSPTQMLADTDRAMRDRGWTRLIGVQDNNENVLIYTEDDASPDGPLSLCLAVVNGKELVVVSTAIDPDALQELIALKGPQDFRNKFHLAGRL